MSYDIIPISDLNNIPDYVRESGPSELTKALARGGSSNIKRISIRGGVFRCVVAGEEVAKNKSGYMDVIILNVALDYNRSYYDAAYDPKGDAKPPRCWSADSKRPAPEVSKPMAQDCDSCPMNIKGSGQGDSRACRMRRRMAVGLAQDLDSGVYQMELPGASIFGKGDGDNMPFNQYIKYINSQNFSIERVVTRMYFDDEADTPKLYFKAVGFPPPQMLPALIELLDSDEVREAVKFEGFQIDEGKALPAPEVGAKQPVVEEEEEEEEEEEVIVVKKKKKKVVEVEEDDDDDDDDDSPSFGVPTVSKKKKKLAEPVATADTDNAELKNALKAFSSKRDASEVDDED